MRRRTISPSQRMALERGNARDKFRQLSNRIAMLIRRGSEGTKGWSETSRGRCYKCKSGRSNSSHTSGVRRFRHTRWIPNPNLTHTGVIASSDDLCALCVLHLENGT